MKKPHWTQTPKGRAFMRRSALTRFGNGKQPPAQASSLEPSLEPTLNMAWQHLSVAEKRRALAAIS
jgi:hypothetical protein